MSPAFGRKRREFLDVVQPSPFFAEAFILANRKLGAFKLIDLKSKNVDKLKPFAFFFVLLIELVPE